jgi:hypothetical protein
MAYTASTTPRARRHLQRPPRHANDNAAAAKPERKVTRVSRLAAADRMDVYRIVARMIRTGHPRAMCAFDLAFDRVPLEAR